MRSKKASTMSFDSRLLRPRRSNSSSASSALVSVGVTSDGRRTRSGGLAGRAMASGLCRLLLAQARVEPRAERCDDSADDALDLLVGQRALVVADLEADGEAALADRDAGRTLRRLEDVEQGGAAHGTFTGGIDRVLQRRMADVAADHDRDVAPRRLLLRQRREGRHGATLQRFGVELEDDRVARDVIGLAPARVQLADDADALAVELDRRAAARMQRRMRRSDEARDGRCEQRLNIALDVEEIDASLAHAPLRRRDRAEGEAAEPKRLAHPGNAERARHAGGVANEHLAELEHPQPRKLARK